MKGRPYAVTVIVFYVVGYNLMFVGVDQRGWIGSPTLLYGATGAERALLCGDGAAAGAVVGSGRAAMAEWMFPIVFVGSVASIVSGTLAERVKLHAFLLFIAILAAFIYPAIGSWTWGGGWLAAMGFRDLAGSTVVHSTGGWAALAAVPAVGSTSTASPSLKWNTTRQLPETRTLRWSARSPLIYPR